MLVSMTGIGVAADRAIPGDVLYPLDRALEAVGLSSPLVEERLLEAIALTERGEMLLAVETANEALAELGRSGVTATLPVATTDNLELTADTVEASSTTTTEEEAAPTTTRVADDDDAPVVDTADEVVEAAPDAGQALRLAAEQLLQSVRSAKVDPTISGEVTSAALFLAETTAGATDDDTTAETSSTTSSSTTTSTSTTSTTLAEESQPGNRNGNDDGSGTTTTTLASDPDDGSGSDDSEGDGEDDSPGPIFLPSP